MGTHSHNNQRYLTNEEINTVLNQQKSLKNIFDQLKNADGVFSLEELRAITLGLIDEYILKRIINICGTREIGMSCQDFLYFYALLNTSSATAKLQFILDFIFDDKKKIDKDEYIYNVKKYLYNSGTLLKIFLSDKILNKNIENNNNNDKIKREDVYNIIMNNFSEDFINYKLYKNKENNYQDNENITISDNQNIGSVEQSNINNKTSKLIDDSDIDSENQIIENEPGGDIFNNKDETLVINTEMSKNNQNGNNNSFLSNIQEENNNNKTKDKNNKENDKSTTLNKQKPSQQNSVMVPKIKLEKNIKNEKMKKAFQKIVKEENGVFPIALFEKMLKEINVIQSLIDVIGNFLRQKSQKTFINFQNFKEILNLIIIPDTNFTLIEDEKNNTNNKENNNNNFKKNTDETKNEKTKEEIIDGLFTLFAYPNEFIHKKNFFLFAKSTKPGLSSNTIKDWFNQYKITKFINKQKFKEIIEFILDELYESFEHIKYLPYIFLKMDVPDKKTEKKCIDVLLKNKTLDEYFQERLQIDNDFYIIEKEFWDKWNLSMSKFTSRNYNISQNLTNNLSLNIANEMNNLNNVNTSISNLKNNISNDANLNATLTITNPLKNNENQEPTLKFNTNKIADKDGKLKEGLVYMKDFVVLSSRMYQLFYRWYGTKKDIEIKRSKIYLEEENDIITLDKDRDKDIDKAKDKDKNENINSNLFPNINNNSSSNKISISKIHLNNIERISFNSTRNNLISQSKVLTKNYSFLKGINKNTNQKFELEIYPIFLSFFNFVDMQKKDCSSLNQVIDCIRDNCSKGDVRYYPFSRKSKYSDLLQTLQNSLKIPLNKNNSRLWVYYKNSFDIVDLKDTLEKYGIVNSAIVILEINENNFWPSDRLKKENLNKTINKNLNLVGLANIGNTCYMNSILQLFLNNAEIKKIFLDKGEEDNKFYEFNINISKNKKKINNGELITEFISLLREKFVKGKKTITPKKFKEICGNYNSTFKGYDQQDAHDFYTFLVDNLHEETNIKSGRKKYDVKEESDTIDTSEYELSNEYWANTIRQNASYIYDLFFGQMKSTLTCNECNKIKIKYENFSAVELPIFEGKKIILEIILFRLPCTLSPFYKTENLTTNEINNNIINNKSNKNYNISTKKTTDMTNNYQNSSNKPTTKNYMNSLNDDNNGNNDYCLNLQETKGTKSSLRKKLKKLKISNIGKYADNLCSSLNLDPEILNVVSNEENKYNKMKGGNNNDNSINKLQTKFNDESNLNTALFEKYNKNEDDNKIYEIINRQKTNKSNNKNEIISNPLNLNIPIKLRIEIERNKKNGEIIDILRNMEELKLEKNPQYTEFIILSKNKYVKLDTIIDETFLNFEQIFIYELLNYEGIKKIFGYDDLTLKATPLEKQDIQSMLEIIEDENDINNKNVMFNAYNKEINDILDDSSSDLDKQNSKSEKKEKKDKNELNSINNILNNNNNEISEILIAIFHEYRSFSQDREEDHFKIFNFIQCSQINNTIDFIILTNKFAIKPVDLYEIIWEKYMYFINSPTKYESSLWWKPYSFSHISSLKNASKEENNINQNDIKNNESINLTSIDYQKCCPFVIKIIKKATRACIFCPWFRLCQGCILNPNCKNYLSITNDCAIMVEWKRDVVKKDMKEENISYILNHSSSKKIFETSQDEEEKKSIYDCLDLFTREETMKNIFCEKCNKKTNFKKRLEIDKFPKYLTLILKRFKYTKMFTTKIDNLIQFPLENLDMTSYITPKEGKIKYDLFGVVNHVGTLSGGHYHCDIKQDNIWVKYDDSYTTEYVKKIMTENAYLLIYKLGETKNIYNEVIKHEFKLNLLGLMDTAYKIYLKQYNFEHYFNYVYENNKTDTESILQEYVNNCYFYYGEPITVNGKMGFLVNIFKNEDNDKVYIKIKLKKGYYETNVIEKKIIKETVKVTEEEDGKEIEEGKNKNGPEQEQGGVFCGSCIIN